VAAFGWDESARDPSVIAAAVNAAMEKDPKAVITAANGKKNAAKEVKNVLRILSRNTYSHIKSFYFSYRRIK